MAASNEPSWKDDMEIYPPAEEIAKALQDLGKSAETTNKVKKETTQKSYVLDKVCKKVVDHIRSKFGNPD